MFVFLLVAAALLVAIGAHLLRLIVLDGYGSLPTPRSHVEEGGTAADRELSR